MNAVLVCRAGLWLSGTGALTVWAGAPYAGWLTTAGLLVLAGGGWMVSR